MKNLICTIIFVLPLLLGAGNVSADEIYAIADMYTDPDHSDEHSVEQLWVANYSAAGNFQRIMMRFDLDDYTGHTVDQATLNLYRFFGCPSGGVTSTIMYHITNDWDEDTWPENVHIDHGDTEYGYYNFSVNGWQQLDISSIVQAWLNGDIPNYGFVIEATTGSKFSKFYSREAGETYQPYLELSTLTDIESVTENIPSEITLGAYPNPFNASTTIEYSLPGAAEVSIEIYNILGQNVETLVNEYQQAGYHSLTWNGNGVPSGIYFLNITTDNYSQSHRLVMLK